MNEPILQPEQLTQLFHDYSEANIIEATRNSEAFANEVYDVTDSEGQRFFLKILKDQLPEVVANEAQMQQHLLETGLQTPEYLAIKPGTYVGNHQGTRFVLSKYISGEAPKNVTPTLVKSYGSTLAKIHDGLSGTSIPPNNMQWLNLENTERDLSGFEGQKKPDIDRLVTTGKVIFDRDLPMAVTHGDLWMSNVFARDDEITTVFDLETAEYTVRLLDLARTFTSMKFSSEYSSKDITELLIQGYNLSASEPLNANELASFNLAIAFVAGACATWHAINDARYAEPYISFGNEALGL